MKYSFEQLMQIEKEIGTPCFLVNEELFIESLNNIKSAFLQKYENLIVGYSFKTNYLPYLCRIAKQQGCYAEVVSFLEYQIAEKIGFPYDQIIFNGPVKRKNEFFYALSRGSLINIDSHYEIDYLEEYRKLYPQAPISLGIRVNVLLKDSVGNTSIYGGAKTGRFGFIPDELSDVMDRLMNLNCSIISIHGHTSSRNRAVTNYSQISRHLLKVIKEFSLDIKYFDIGGGFYGAIPEGMLDIQTPSFEEYASEVMSVLLEDSWFIAKKPYLVIEPGMSVAASSMSYLTKIYSIKKRDSKILAQVDGDMFHIRPSMHKLKLPFQICSKEGYSHPIESTNLEVVGSTCMESDILLWAKINTNFSNNDYIIVDNVGAYTFVENTNFIQFSPAVCAVKEEEILCLRRGNDFENFIDLYNW